MPPMTPSDKETGKQAVRHVETSSSWRAVCGERRKHGSEGGQLEKYRLTVTRWLPTLQSNPRGNVTCVARYQGLDVGLSWLLPLKGGFAPVMPGVRT